MKLDNIEIIPEEDEEVKQEEVETIQQPDEWKKYSTLALSRFKLKSFGVELRYLKQVSLEFFDELTTLNGDLVSLEKLTLFSCNKFTCDYLPESLKSLTIDCCKEFKNFNSTKNKSKLTDLTINYCCNFSGENLTKFNLLQTLTVNTCKSFTFHSKVMPTLTELSLVNCDSLNSLDGSMFPELKILKVKKCKNFKNIVNKFPKLEELYIDTCLDFDFISINSLKQIKLLQIENCNNFIGDEFLRNLQISDLRVFICNNFKNIEDGAIKSLTVYYCESFDESSLPNTVITKKLYKNGPPTRPSEQELRDFCNKISI